jgi:hypothetical protein
MTTKEEYKSLLEGYLVGTFYGFLLGVTFVVEVIPRLNELGFI